MNPDRKIITVSQLNRDARFLLEQNFTTIWVEGEISNLSRPASGHIYFTLKDEGAQIRCAMFRNRLNYIRFRPENGAHVEIRGSVSLYEARGDYQLIAEHMEEGGEGALQRAFEALKKMLLQEGLFDERHKQQIPPIPTKIGIISSPTGAAVHDIITVLKRRFPALPVILYPVSVQGESAVAEIIAALELAQQRNECDLLIIARGGGSIEDLWVFNEEQVARAIYNSPIPTISAIGHETDFTIADFVADLRAPTPSAAAETVSPDRLQWRQSLQQLEHRLSGSIRRELEALTLHLHGMERQLHHPRDRIRQLAQRLDEREQQLGQTINHQLQRRSDQISAMALALNALNPLSTLSRGYSITTTAEGEVVRNADWLQNGEVITTRLHRGEITSKITGLHPSRKA